MPGRIVEIAEDGRHLELYRGFLQVKAGGELLGRVPLDDIIGVIANARALTYSNNILVALAERGVPFVLCASNFKPVGMVWPVESHHLQAARMDAQLAATLPLKKRLWRDIVRSKLLWQGWCLQQRGRPHVPLTALVARVRSGDTGNVEAQGARRYWPLLLGTGFVRDRDLPDVNALLNYGYAVLRACVGRAVIAAGLHPGIPIHHSNQFNAQRLCDDLMEPFRPVVDLTVATLHEAGVVEVDPASKAELVRVLSRDLPFGQVKSPLDQCAQRLASSLAAVYLGEREELELPTPDWAPPA